VIFIDAINVKIRDGQVANRPVYVALAVTRDGHRDILGLWAGDGGEGAKYWQHVLTELKNRGVGDVLMIVCDGLTGLPDAITNVWPATITQTCIVHYADLRIMPMLSRDRLQDNGFVLARSA
jgi:transposase-like protein